MRPASINLNAQNRGGSIGIACVTTFAGARLAGPSEYLGANVTANTPLPGARCLDCRRSFARGCQA